MMINRFVWMMAVLLLVPVSGVAMDATTLKKGVNEHEVVLGTIHPVGKEGIALELPDGKSPHWNEFSPYLGYHFRRGLTDRLDASVHLQSEFISFIHWLPGILDLRVAYQLMGGDSSSGLSLKFETGWIGDGSPDFLVPLELTAGFPVGKSQVGLLLGIWTAPNNEVTDADNPVLLIPHIGVGGRMPLGKQTLSLRLSYVPFPDPIDPDPEWQTLVGNTDGALFIQFGAAF